MSNLFITNGILPSILVAVQPIKKTQMLAQSNKALPSKGGVADLELKFVTKNRPKGHGLYVFEVLIGPLDSCMPITSQIVSFPPYWRFSGRFRTY